MLNRIVPTLVIALIGSSCAPAAIGTTPDVARASGRIEILSGDLQQYRGLVVNAPHASYDTHTGEMVRIINREMNMPAVCAWGFRMRGGPIWLDVNRPTERFQQASGMTAQRYQTDGARAVYGDLQQALFDVAGVEEGAVDLHVDIHGHSARYDRPDGTRPQREVIEAVAVGFTDEGVNRIKAEYERLCVEMNLADPPPLWFLQTDPFYEIDGVEVDFVWTASGARGLGVLRQECANRGLHFETPRGIRFDEARRRVLARVYGGVIEFVWCELIEE